MQITKNSKHYRPKLEIYTDGSCKPNPGKGGAASLLIKKEKVISKRHSGKAFTNNQEMELMGMILGLNNLRAYVTDNVYEVGYRVAIYTDSRYVRDGIMFWMKDWERNGWKNGKGELVKNPILWQSIKELIQILDNLNIRLRFHWVKSHTGNKFNEMVDKEAEYARSLSF